ncbi:3'(2'),5'-bisphosphate nucleotidase CysQ [Pseudohalocynthiibacter aestuariivivens]|uniref:3'(2'),5'-bisphosphate nucleotidase CysQ n=1 Tax=Roseovarius pelagicus TaxID=2980108 RepID=A0ABY6DAF1_9RHOB|nr:MULTISPECIES: 3'(2'),5'-bisphosphate nucleotidase CysQ [Rhodobacterales]QIE45536.1 3'(2'),5'-bisphosphate nucleotidase CysQ [Pseudohalocynthiibacter aestuariivivens]UXX82545.1 3'(2'),5'-bisphosphate nucleotidase CysQ [Roseovarius pelagicus]
MTNPADIKVQVMRRLAILAGHEIMQIYERDDFDICTKSDDSPVTLADQLADRLIHDGLRTAFPDTAIVTEEQAATHAETARSFFIVDPLDGTKEFIHRRGEFTVNIAWVEAGEPVLGVVYAPARARLFYTDENGTTVEELGALSADQVGETRPLSVSKPDPDALIVVASKSHRDAATDAYIAQYHVADMRSAGSSLKFCLVACAEADLYPRLGRTMEWDTAAGQAVLKGAGGQVLRADTLTPLTYGKLGFENPHFIACAPGFDLKT